MTGRHRAAFIAAVLFGALTLLLSGCLTLSADVTPPPVNTPITSQAQDALPRQLPTQTPDLDPLDSAGNNDPGSVKIEVIDQTGGTLLDKGLSVRLEGYDQFDLIFQTSQDLPLSGQITFRDVPIQSQRIFFASVAYEGAVYRSEIVQADPETTSLNLRVQIFDTTTETSQLVIDRLHLLVDFPGPDLVQVSEIIVLSNLGSDSVVAESPGKTSLEFSLPEGADSLVFEDGILGERYLKTEAGFGDTVSIPPGQEVYQVVFSYLLPYTRNRLAFVQSLNYPLNAHVVLVPAGVVQVKQSSLRDLGEQTIANGQIQVFSGGEIPAGETLEFKLTGSPYGSSDGTFLSGDISRWLMIGLGVIGLGLLASGIWLYIKKQPKILPADSKTFSAENRDQLLDSIIALEDLYQEGEVSEKDYQKKRDQLKERLRELIENE